MTDYPLTWLASVLRDAGCRVVEESGWKTRGRPASSGSFHPRAVLRHWDASSKGSHGAISTVVNGTGDTPGPLCSILTCRGNDSHGPAVHVIAAGRANHGGTGQSWGVIPADDANTYAVGHEIAHTTDEKWSSAQLDQVRLAEAAILTRLGAKPGNALPCHAEYAPDRKIDTTGGSYGQNMKSERSAVADVMAGPDEPSEETMRYWNVNMTVPVPLKAATWQRVLWDNEASDEGAWHKEGNSGVYVPADDGLIVSGVYCRVSGGAGGRIALRVMRAEGGSSTGAGLAMAETAGTSVEPYLPLTLDVPPFGGSDQGLFVELRADFAATLDYIQFRGVVSPRP